MPVQSLEKAVIRDGFFNRCLGDGHIDDRDISDSAQKQNQDQEGQPFRHDGTHRMSFL